MKDASSEAFDFEDMCAWRSLLPGKAITDKPFAQHLAPLQLSDIRKKQLGGGRPNSSNPPGYGYDIYKLFCFLSCWSAVSRPLPHILSLPHSLVFTPGISVLYIEESS